MAQTDRTIRDERKWCKITRDSAARTFTFACGDAGVMKAKEVTGYPMKLIPTWADAEERARAKMSACR